MEDPQLEELVIVFNLPLQGNMINVVQYKKTKYKIKLMPCSLNIHSDHLISDLREMRDDRRHSEAAVIIASI